MLDVSIAVVLYALLAILAGAVISGSVNGSLELIAYVFFSSRRRHTRWTGEWSSDVCSSDSQQLENSRTPIRPRRYFLPAGGDFRECSNPSDDHLRRRKPVIALSLLVVLARGLQNA